MNPFEQIQTSFTNYLIQKNIAQNLVNAMQFELNTDEQKQQFADINCNIAMICAQTLKQNPRALAQQISTEFSHPLLERIEIAGPGFLNFWMKPDWFVQIAQQITEQKDNFFKTKIKNPSKTNIEFVSANPTGPMHVGHGRNGILGDVLGNILAFLGYDIAKEFYINDAGAQIQKLGNSLKIRCLQQLGQDLSLPEDAYHGQYLIDVAQDCVQEFGTNLQHEPDQFFQNYAKEKMLQQLQQTLQNYGIIFDIWFSEKSLHDHGKIKQAIARLTQAGHTFEQDGALWFASTKFGDDKDRVLQKANGELTYAAADVAYLIDKIERGFETLIMVLGHDHHSYKTRLESIMQALGYDKSRLHVILYQLVHIIKDGVPVKMSKRSGDMVTLSEIVQEVGKDVARFFFLNRKADAELQFDVNLALKHSNENPMFYIQYALVRTISIQNKLKELKLDAQPKLEPITDPAEKLLIKKICSLKNLIANIAHHYQIHLLAYHTYELASLFHQYYNAQRIIDPENNTQTQHRLYIVNAVQQSLQTALFLMGITPMEKM